MRKRKASRNAIGTRAPIQIEARANVRWTLYFLHEHFACGRRFRILKVVDDVTQECPAAIGYQTPAGFALHLTTPIARPAARDESSARRAIAQPAPTGVNQQRATVVAGWETIGRSNAGG